MKRQLDRLTTENAVTYKGVFLLCLAMQFVGIGANQIIEEMKWSFGFQVPQLPGTYDAIAVAGLFFAAISGWLAFQQIRMADAQSRDTRQQGIKEEIIREVNEGKMLSDRVAERVDSAERELYRLGVRIDNHIELEIHPGAVTKFMQIEDKLYKVHAAVSILNRDAEYAFRLSKLEKILEEIRTDNRKINLLNSGQTTISDDD